MSFPLATSTLLIYVRWCDLSLLLFIGCFLFNWYQNRIPKIVDDIGLNPNFTAFKINVKISILKEVVSFLGV